MNLNEKEKNTYLTIEKVVNEEITKKEAEEIIGKTRRQIDRLIIKYKKEGKNGFIHKNRGKISNKKIDRNIILKLEELYLTEYYDYNFEAFYEEIENEYKISYSLMVVEFKKDDIISPISHKKTIKLYNEKLNKSIDEKDITEEQEELFKSRLLSYEKAHPRKSNNLYAFGQEVQMDACFKIWFGNESSALHLAVDKGTKKVFIWLV